MMQSINLFHENTVNNIYNLWEALSDNRIKAVSMFYLFTSSIQVYTIYFSQRFWHLNQDISIQREDVVNFQVFLVQCKPFWQRARLKSEQEIYAYNAPLHLLHSDPMR